jgi:hypothetical protein
MIRKFLTVLAISALPIGFLATLGAGPAQAAAPVVFKGSISCSLTGTITFKPPLATANTTMPTTATFTGTNNHCKGVKKTSLKQGGETLKASKDNFSFTIPASTNGSCSSLATGTVPAITTAVKWIGTSPIAPTKIAYPAGTISVTNGVIEYLKGVSTGSFAGSAQVALQATKISEGNGTVVAFSVTNALTACGASGIADLTLAQPKPEPKPFSKNDNMEVGKAF